MKFLKVAVCLIVILLFAGCGNVSQTGVGTRKAATTVLASDLPITGPNDNYDHSQPSVAYGGQSQYLVVWTDYRNASASCSGGLCGTDIFGKICTGSGTGKSTSMSCGSDFLISNSYGDPVKGDQTQPKAAYDIYNQKYLVVWTDSRTTGYTQIWGQYVNPDGSLDGVNAAITPHVDNGNCTGGGGGSPSQQPVNCTASYLNQSESSLIYNATTDMFDIAWLEDTDSDTVQVATVQPSECNNAEIVQYITVIGGADTNMVRTGEINGAYPLTSASNVQNYSELTFVKTSGFIASQGSITADFEAQVDETHPEIFYNKSTGEYFAVWQGRTNSVTFSQAYTAKQQTGTSTDDVIPTDASPSNSTWAAGSKVQLTSSDPITAVSGVLSSTGDTVTNLNMQGLGTTNVTVIIGQGSNVIGESSSINFTLTLDQGKACTYDVENWTVNDNDGGLQKIKVRRPTGTQLIGKVYKDLTFGTNNSYNPAVTTDPNTQRALLVWEEDSGAAAGKDINGALIDLTNFSEYSSGINVSNAPGDQTNPVVSFDNVNQRYLITWEDARNQSANISNIDIFSQFVDPQGNLSGANSPVTVAPGNQLAPAVAFGDSDFRQFLVAWSDGRQPDHSDIYGELLQYSQSPQLLIEVEDPAGSGNYTPLLNSSIDFGNFAIGLNNNVPESTSRNIRICNNGNTQLTINSMSQPDAPFSIPTPVPVTISPAICADMQVDFAPFAAGSFAGNPSNNFKTTIDSDGGQVTIYFSGIGTGTQSPLVLTSSLPDADTMTAYNQPLLAFGGVYPFTWSVSDGSLPPGMSIDPASGRITGTPTQAGSYTFTVEVADNNGSTATRQYTINVSVLTITNTNTTLKDWTVGKDYGNAPVVQITAAGGTAPYTWSISSGNLPTGLSIDPSTGVITGVASKSGKFQFTVKVTESGGQTATKTFTISINPPPTITTASLPDGITGRQYYQTLKESAGTPAITWSIASGSLPPGLTFDSTTGIISGIPTGTSTNNFTVQVADAAGATGTKDYTIKVNASGTAGSSVSNSSGGGCSISPRSGNTTALGDVLVFLLPLVLLFILKRTRRKKA